MSVVGQLLGVLRVVGLGLLLVNWRDRVGRWIRRGMRALLRRTLRVMLVYNAGGSRVLLQVRRSLTLGIVVGMMLHIGNNH